MSTKSLIFRSRIQNKHIWGIWCVFSWSCVIVVGFCCESIQVHWGTNDCDVANELVRLVKARRMHLDVMTYQIRASSETQMKFRG